MTERILPSHPVYTPDQLSRLSSGSEIPHHIAIIPDGNRRWAKRQQMNSCEGHRHGGDVLMQVVKAAKELGVKVLTFYTFSTENWNRSEEEVAAFMILIANYLLKQREEMIRCGIRLHTIGDSSRLPSELNRIVDETKKATQMCSQFDLVLALNYGGRDDIRRAMHSILDDYEREKVKKEEITEALISRYLDTGQWSDPNLLIRTSGEMRVSNFLLWQISYAEMHVTRTFWPEFTPENLLEAIVSYQQRERRLGGA